MKKIAVVQGVPSAEVQDLFGSLAERWRPSARLAGVIAQDHGLVDRACTAGYLVSVSDGERFQIFQDLGPGAEGCHLAAAGVLAAADAVRREIAEGCDLVILSKFGKLEKDGGGLREAFAAAIEADVPVLTSVSVALMPAWQTFAAPLSVAVPPNADGIDAWWQGVRFARPHQVSA